MKSYSAVITLLLLACIGCSKPANRDNNHPVIVLDTPVSGQIFTPGQAIRISGTITDDQFIAEVHIHVRNEVNSSLLMDVHLNPHNTHAVFDQSITGVAGTNYSIDVKAKDRALNESGITRYVSCN